LAPPVEVYDKDGRKVRAKMLVDPAGRYVRDPMTGMPLIVDEDFDMDRAIAFGRSLANIPETGDGAIAKRAAPGLPQHVIDAGNYLRANGYEITPRTMYVSHVLGPQAAVDLFKRTGSTSSDAVPSPDAATGDQMRAWARQLRLGPSAGAGAIAGMAPMSDVGLATPGQPNEDATASTQPLT
jgi:hypothetical protein